MHFHLNDPLVFSNSENEARDDLRGQLEGIAQGDENALRLLYDATVGRVYGLALRIVGKTQTAEDVAADVYFQIWREAARFNTDRGHPLGWILSICRSRALDALRRQDPAELHADPHAICDQALEGCDPIDLLQVLERDCTLYAAVAALVPVQRQLIALAFFRGLTHQEIADCSFLPLGSVKTHLRQALSQLKQAFNAL